MAKIKNDDRWYEPTLPCEIKSSTDGIEIRPKLPSGTFIHEVTKTCAHCGRGDLVEVVYHSFEEAVNAGLFVESSAP